MNKKICIGIILFGLLFVSGCGCKTCWFNKDYCEAYLECMEKVAEEFCEKNNCVVVDIHNYECGGQYTVVLNKETREKIDFNFLPEEHELCKTIAEIASIK